jgi:predicted ATPase/DNA-binding winged helix-turn-helix (wHTH) protein
VARKVPARGQLSIYGSGGWEVDLAKRELRTHGQFVPIGGRAFDLLEVMVQSAGQLVTKDELMTRVWPGAIVEESALHVHMSAIRKALGADRALVKTVFGRGYRLLGQWQIRQGSMLEHPVGFELERSSQRTNVPLAVSALVGRDAAKEHLLNVMSAYRVVTLTGPGGIGKSVLSLEVAHCLYSTSEEDCWYVELASLSDPALLPSAVARVLQLRVGDERSAEAIARAIGSGKLLLVLDNCEHLIDAVARFVETVVRICPRVSILATSREVLRIEGEYIYRVPPLDVPPEHPDDPNTIREFSAAQLFISRLAALDDGLSLRHEDLLVIAAICKHLDGIPLAIEFGAARAAALGLPQIVTRLDDRFNLLTAGRRTALPRQQTLRATLDWSYDLLPPAERSLLHRLAIFAGGFTLEAAAAIMYDTIVSISTVADRITSLIDKSLVALDASVPSGRWRLLETVRVYALRKLTESGEANQVARRHAEYFRDLVSNSRAMSEEDLACCTSEIDNVRAALDWSFSPSGDPEVGIALTAAYCLVWLDLSMFFECRERTERALKHFCANPALAVPLQMQLQIALGIALIITLGPVQRAKHALDAGLRLADELADLDAQVRALRSLWAVHVNIGDYGAARSIAERLLSAAALPDDLLIAAVAHRIMGYTLLYMGRQRDAHASLKTALELGRSGGGQRHRLRFLSDQQLLARASLARSLWLQGLVDQARNIAEACVADARAGGDKLALYFIMNLSVCPITFMIGDLVAAQRYTDELIEGAIRQSFTQYENNGRYWEAMLLIERGEFATASVRLREVLNTFENGGWTIGYSESMCALARSLASLGRLGEALSTIDHALLNAEKSQECWYVPELLGIKGELRARSGNDETVAESRYFFKGAAELAQQQGALFWELRAAMRLAHVMVSQKQHRQAREVLTPVYNKFKEGFDTVDLRAARALLERLPPRRALS